MQRPRVVNRVAQMSVVTIPGKSGRGVSDGVREISLVAYEDEHGSSASEGETQPDDASYSDSS
jgi:hypothetical protein